MTVSLDKPAIVPTSAFALEIAVVSAQHMQVAALTIEPSTCGMMYPFGIIGEKRCPVCSAPVYMHLGFPDQRDLIDR